MGAILNRIPTMPMKMFNLILAGGVALGMLIDGGAWAVKVIAHRGDSFHHPENTLPAFKSAVDKKADFVELDSRVTKDGRLVCQHDGALEKKSNVAEILGSTDFAVEALTFEQTQQLDVGSWKNSSFKGTRIPTLEESIEEIQKGSVTLLERKTGSALDHAKLVERLGYTEDLVIQSFDWDFLAALRTWLPDAKLGALSGKEVTEEKLRDIRRMGVDLAVWHHEDVTEQNFPLFAKHGLELWTYTVNDPVHWKRLVDLGVTGLITDKPGELLEWLEANGHR